MAYSLPGQLARLIQAQHELRSVSQRGGQEAPAMKAVRRLNGGALAALLGDQHLTPENAIPHEAPIQRARIYSPDALGSITGGVDLGRAISNSGSRLPPPDQTPTITEDDPRWNWRTMGNHRRGNRHY